jgi:hypothetical protein
VSKKKSVLEMTAEEFERAEKERKEKQDATKALLDKMDASDFYRRLLHLFEVKKPPRLHHLHILIKKVRTTFE